MNFSKSLGKNVAIVAVIAAGAAIQACSDDTTTGGGGGTGSGGKGSGGAAGGAGVVNSGGAGTTGTGGIAGSVNAGGTAGAGGATGGAGGDAGSAGTAGGGGTGGAAPTILYDFETDVQLWGNNEDNTVVAAVSPDQFVTGAQSLKVTVPAIPADSSKVVFVNAPALWPGAVITLHVWTPAGTDGLYVQGYTQVNNYGTFTPGAGVTLMRGAWTTMTVTVPAKETTFPGGFNRLGVQFGVPAAAVPFAGGDFYIDSITAVDGTADCSGTDTGSYDFEANTTPWAVDNAAANPDTAISWSPTQYHGGAYSMAVTFTNLPAGTVDAPTNRQIILPTKDPGTKAYCGDTVTAHVWIPTGSEQIKFQVYGQYNNYTKFTGAFPAAYTYDGWTMQSYLLPATGDPSIGPGGLQYVGVQFQNTGAAYTGTLYIDDVSW